MAEVMLGKEARSRAAALCWRRPPDRKYAYGAGPLPDLAVREGDWKLMCDFDGSQPWLYHLKEDPGETINRATQEPEVVARLTQVVLTWNETLPEGNSVALGKEPPPSTGGKRKKQ